MTSIIYSARPTVAITFFSLENDFVYEIFKSGDVEYGCTDESTEKIRVKIVISTGRDYGSASWIKINGRSLLQTPIVGLAKWSVLGGLFAHEPEELYSSLHLALLQGLTEVQRSRRNLKSEVVAVKRVNLLIQKIEMALDHDISNQEKCLDRLGQFLQAITAAECLSGKTVEIINALKRLPSNKLIQMYVVYLAGVN